MKIITFIFFLYFSIYANGGTFAANNSLNSNYPSPSGSYNKIVITPPPPAGYANFICNNASNVGMLYYDTASNTMQLCAKLNGVPTPVPANEVCFNRFWNSGGATVPNGCPTINGQAYTQATTMPPDSFTTAASCGPYTPCKVYSTVCCSANSVVHP